MKKITKILSLIIPTIILNTRVYAFEINGMNLGGTAKYAGMGIALAIMIIIIYIAYRSDKKEEASTEEEVIEYEIPYEEESVMESGSFLDEPEVSTSDLIEESEYEEETLYNVADNYIESTEKYSMLDEEENDSNEINNELSFDNNKDDEFNNVESEFTFEEKQEQNLDTKEENFEQNNEEVSFDIEESFEEEPSMITPIINLNEEDGKFFDTEITEEVNNISEKKRFTRKKETNNNEINILENLQEDINGFEVDNEFEYEEEDDDDDDTPTFDELLKKSEEEIKENIGSFDFMAEMEENLKKDQAKRLQKNTTKKSTTKKNETIAKKSTSKTKGVAQKKSTSKSKEDSYRKTTKKKKEE